MEKKKEDALEMDNEKEEAIEEKEDALEVDKKEALGMDDNTKNEEGNTVQEQEMSKTEKDSSPSQDEKMED